MNFAEQLRTLRQRHDCYKKAKDFVEALDKRLEKYKLHIGYTAYSTYERGTREPRLIVLAEMAEMLGTTTDNLLGIQTDAEHPELNTLIINHLLMGEEAKCWTDEGDIIIGSDTGKLYKLAGSDLDRLVKQVNQDWHQEVERASKDRQKKLEQGIDRLLEQQREKLVFEPDSALGQILLWSTSLDLDDFSRKRFMQGFKPEQISLANDGDERINLFTGLCFVYFTGINPLEKDSRAKAFVEAYHCGRCRQRLPENMRNKEFHDWFHNIVYTYQPKRRSPGLEAYVAYLVDLDYNDFREKFKETGERFHRLQMLFLDYLVQVDYNTLITPDENTVADAVKGEPFNSVDRFEKIKAAYYDVSLPIKQEALKNFGETMSTWDEMWTKQSKARQYGAAAKAKKAKAVNGKAKAAARKIKTVTGKVKVAAGKAKAATTIETNTR